MKTKLDRIIEGKGEVSGTTFTQVYENENGYIYKADTGDSEHYEAFYKKEVAICIDFAKRIYSETDTKEIYPKSKDFGVWAWTYPTIKEAKLKLLTTP